MYAMGTAIRYTHSVQQLEKKGVPYNIESAAVDGMDVLAVIKAANDAVEKVRTTGKPYFLVCNTYRFRAHSMFDAELYREKSEVEEWRSRDPIPNFQNYLISKKLISENDVKELEKRAETEVQRAVDFAEAGTWEPVEQLTKYVYSEKP
jgi:pyruvate dehydrogenase E1 component alpha subunit/2-oxoisovalerate dehydrogenase E1 component